MHVLCQVATQYFNLLIIMVFINIYRFCEVRNISSFCRYLATLHQPINYYH
ncbi:Hypothetical protein ABZS17D1_01069 [Kosakonia cowanii]